MTVTIEHYRVEYRRPGEKWTYEGKFPESDARAYASESTRLGCDVRLTPVYHGEPEFFAATATVQKVDRRGPEPTT